MTLITIVIPIYNVEAYLHSCLDSVLNQTYPNLQIILVDDGSTDSSGKICDDYLEKDSRIEVIHKPNGGLSDARNAGIERAKGEFITFIDSDDVIERDMIHYLLELIYKDDADISVCQRELIDEDGKIIKTKSCIHSTYILRSNIQCMHDFLANKGIDTVAWGKLYRTNLFSNIRYPIGKYNEDVFTTYLIVAKSNIISVGKEQKYFYRIRRNSIMKSHFSPKHLDGLEGKVKQATFISKEYPQDLFYARAAIVYSANKCVLKMAESNCTNEDYCKLLQNYFRDNEYYYLLYSKSNLFAKLHSILCFISVRMTIRIDSIILNKNKYVKGVKEYFARKN